MSTILFYLFGFVMLGFALYSQLAKNSVSQVISLVGAFFCAAVLCIMLQAEFIATMLVVVYMGAIAMLFLFVVMIVGGHDLNIKPRQFILPGTVLAISLWIITYLVLHGGTKNLPSKNQTYNISRIGEFLYSNPESTPYTIFYIGFILLSALLAAVMLTIQYKAYRKYTKKEADANIKLIKPDIGSGIDI